MSNDESQGAQYLSEVLVEFFGAADLAHVHARLHEMQDEARLGRMAMLPRPELAQRAVVGENFKRLVGLLYQAVIADRGEDPNGWKFEQRTQVALSNLLALYFANEPFDHSSASSIVDSTGIGLRRTPAVRRRLSR